MRPWEGSGSTSAASVVSTPAKRPSPGAASTPGAVATRVRSELRGPRGSAVPMSWERCRLRDSMASWNQERPRRGSKTPVAKSRWASSGRRHASRYNLAGRHASTPPTSWSGKRAGSLAASKASRAMMPAAWCWPWPSEGVPLKTETTTCGRKVRTTCTASRSSSSRGQSRSASSALFE